MRYNLYHVPYGITVTLCWKDYMSSIITDSLLLFRHNSTLGEHWYRWWYSIERETFKQCWPVIYDAGPVLNQHCSIFCIRWVNSMLSLVLSGRWSDTVDASMYSTVQLKHTKTNAKRSKFAFSFAFELGQMRILKSTLLTRCKFNANLNFALSKSMFSQFGSLQSSSFAAVHYWLTWLRWDNPVSLL